MHQEQCIRCQGNGYIKCSKCDGSGIVADKWFNDKECPKCNGRGELPCPNPKCNGGIVMVRG